jgi:hypothetical protein
MFMWSGPSGFPGGAILICSHESCTGIHDSRTARIREQALCPRARDKKRASDNAYYARHRERVLAYQLRYRNTAAGMLNEKRKDIRKRGSG